MIKAIIFDMDGVIIDSEKYWRKAELHLFKKLLNKWTTKDQQKTTGLNVMDTYKILKEEHDIQLSKQEYMIEITKIANHIYQKQTNLIDGFLQTIQSIQNVNIPIGLASSSLKAWIQTTLNRFNLKKYFKITVSSEDIDGPSKPAPDIYLYTAKKIGILPNECMVIEDSFHGIQSAKSAGMTCIGLSNGLNKKQDLLSADYIINGYKDFNISELIY